MIGRNVLGLFGVVALAAGMASATMVTLPNSDSTVTFTATVSDQCNVTTLPNAVAFAVTDHTLATDATGKTVTIDNIIVAEGKKIKLSLAPNTVDFGNTLGLAGAKSATWLSSAVSWNNGGEWTTGIGATGTMSGTAGTYVEVATSGANAATLSNATDGLVFTLAANEDIVRSGAYTLVATWKIEGGI